MADTVELEIPARPEYLALARVLVAATVVGEPLFDDDQVDDLRLAVSEACTNAMEAHLSSGDAARTAAPIRIVCTVDHDTVVVSVSDRGRGFDPDDLAEHPPVTDPRRLDFEHGLGIPLIKALADEVEFITSDDGTTVRIVVRADGMPPAGATS